MTNTQKEHKVISSEGILEHVRKTSNDVGDHFDRIYNYFLQEQSEEIAIYYNTLDILINNEEFIKSQSNFQAALLFWRSLNSYIVALELFRRGYLNEPQLITRNILEMISSAYDIYLHPEKLKLLRENKYDSTASITIAKKVLPSIGKAYGITSNYITHISLLHSAPQGDYDRGSLWIGGGFKEDQHLFHYTVMICLLETLVSINEMIELTFGKWLPEFRYERKNENGVPKTQLPERIGKLLFGTISKFQDLTKA